MWAFPGCLKVVARLLTLWLMSPLFFTILIEILKKKTCDATTFFTCSQWLNCGGAKEVGETGRQHEKAHSCSHFSPCFDDTSPTQADDGTSQIHHDIGTYVPYSSRTVSRVLLRPLPGWRRQGQRLNVTAQWRDHLNWERGFTASMISPVV